MRRVVGIDVGYVNNAMCVIDGNSRKPKYWVNAPLIKGKFTEEKLKKAAYDWVKSPEIKAWLDSADDIVLERQMMKKFEAVNNCIRFLYWEKTIELAPNTVGAYFKLPQDRASKKKAAVALVSVNVPFVCKGKKDDLADAYLLATFGLFSKNPVLKEGWVHEYGRIGIKPRASRKERKARDQPVAVAVARPADQHAQRYFIDLAASAGGSEE
jgi:hypothetical protein